jgi:hypothetical protein
MTRILTALAALALSTVAVAAPRYVVTDVHGTLGEAIDACEALVHVQDGAVVRYELATVTSAAELDRIEGLLVNYAWVDRVSGPGLVVTDITGGAPVARDAMVVGPGGVWTWQGRNVDAATAPSNHHYTAVCERR